MRRTAVLLFFVAAFGAGGMSWGCFDALGPRVALAASALSPRHSGLEPPGGPKPLQGLPPAGSRSGTTEGGQGYTDAYGNPVDRRSPEEKAPRQRPRPGAYGTYGSDAPTRPLPDPDAGQQNPAWSFK